MKRHAAYARRFLAAVLVAAPLCALSADAPLSPAETPASRVSLKDANGRFWWRDVYEAQLDGIRKSGGSFDFVLLGDSITYNWQREKGRSYFGGDRRLGKAVADECFAGYRWLNAGIGGDGTSQVLWRCMNGVLDGYKTKVIALMVGTNNRRDSAEDVAKGTKRIVDVIREKQPGAKILLSPILPRFPREDDPGDMNAKNEKTNAIIKELCDGKSVVWFDWRAGLYKDGQLDKDLWYDREHPAEGGYRLWAKALSAFLPAAGARQEEAQWRLSFRIGTNGKEIVLDSEKCCACAEERTAAGRRLVWRGLDLDKGDGAVDVVCTIERNNARSWDEYRIAVTNRSAVYGLFETEYPRFKSLMKPGEGSLIRPGGCWGGRRVRESAPGRAPFPDWTSPFQLAIYEKDAGGGTMVAALDPEGRIKFLNYAANFGISFSTPAEGAGVPGKAGAPDFAVALYRFDGGWVDAAKAYRDWAAKNARWMKKGLLVSRKDRSMAFRDIGMWFLFIYSHDTPLSRTEDELNKAVSLVNGRFPIAAHIYNWHKHPLDIKLPEYFPAREGYAEMAERLGKKGVRIMPYLNGRIWAWDHEGFKAVEKWMCRNADGSLHNERWTNHDFSAVCPSYEDWGDYLVDIGKRSVREYGAGALYYDQIASMVAVPCYAANHGHPIGGGTHWVDGYRKAVEKIHAALPDTPLTSENWSEPYTDMFDGFLVWGPNVGNDVPLIPVTYSGYISTFACRVYKDVSDQAFYAVQARSFLWGAQTGWEMMSILEDGLRHRLEFLFKLAEARRSALEFFADGELLGPVENRVKYEPLKFKVLRWKKKVDAEMPPVMAAEWKAPSGRRMVAVVNATTEPRRFEGAGVSVDLAPLEVRIVSGN